MTEKEVGLVCAKSGKVTINDRPTAVRSAGCALRIPEVGGRTERIQLTANGFADGVSKGSLCGASDPSVFLIHRNQVGLAKDLVEQSLHDVDRHCVANLLTE